MISFYKMNLLLENEDMHTQITGVSKPEIITKLKQYADKLRLMAPEELQEYFFPIYDFIEGMETGYKVLNRRIEELEDYLQRYRINNKRFLIDYPRKEEVEKFKKLESIVMSIEHILEFIKDIQMHDKNPEIEASHLFGLLDTLMEENHTTNRLET